MLLLLMLILHGCAGSKAGDDEAVRTEQGFDPLAMTWSPRALSDAAPCLVGWRSTGGRGSLEVLSGDTPGDPVIWRSPADSDAPYFELMEVSPRGDGMVGALYSDDWGTEYLQRVVLFEPDGSVHDMSLPEGFEGVADVAYCDAGLLAVADHATVESYETTLGIVGSDGRWTALTLAGEVPTHQFIESLTARPGSDLIGLVLKAAGGTGNRDEGMLVFARLAGSTLTVVTPPFADDSLPGAAPLLAADGVTYVRMWSGDSAALPPRMMSVEWSGTAWVEREVVPAGSVGAGPETGQAIAQDPEGGYWLRNASTDAHGQTSTLLHLLPGASKPEPTGVDLGGVDWFTWVQGAKD